MDISRRVGLDVQKPKLVSLNNDQTGTYRDEIKKLAPANPQILVIIFPTNRDDRYAAIKKLCNCDLGLASQVSHPLKSFFLFVSVLSFRTSWRVTNTVLLGDKLENDIESKIIEVRGYQSYFADEL